MFRSAHHNRTDDISMAMHNAVDHIQETARAAEANIREAGRSLDRGSRRVGRDVGSMARKASYATREFVHDNPKTSVTFAVGLGLLIGGLLFLGSRRR